MISPDLLAELREWVVAFGLNRYEVFGIFVVCLIFWRLPLILKHRTEIRALELDHRRKSEKLMSKLRKERQRRVRQGGGNLMLYSAFTWAVLVGIAIFAVVLTKLFLERRAVSNKLLAVASDEFFEGADKLMKTPNELPDAVLGAIETMVASMNNGHGAAGVLRVLKQINRHELKATTVKPDLRSEVNSMRPELIDIFGHTVAAWLNFVTNRHIFYQFAISSELDKLAAAQKDIEPDTKSAGITLLPGVSQNFC